MIPVKLRRLDRELERANVPTSDQYFAATWRETARRLSSASERLAHIPGNGPPTPHPGRDPEFFADDTPGRAEANRRTVEAWERAHGAPDIESAADEARVRLLGGR